MKTESSAPSAFTYKGSKWGTGSAVIALRNVIGVTVLRARVRNLLSRLRPLV